jgi:hypothetical protein
LPNVKDGKMAPTATLDDRVAIDGYDNLEVRRLVPQLRLQSQVELATIDRYERSHQDRRAVLDKLRYLREEEPIDGYDRLGPDEILAALGDADATTLAAVRGYETRLRDRDDVLGGVEQLRRDKQPARPPGAATEEPDTMWRADDGGGIMGGAATVGVTGLVGIAGILMLVSLVILGFLVVAAFAPGVFIH